MTTCECAARASRAEVVAREWERQSKQWEGVVREQREEITDYKLMADEQQARWENLAEHLTLEIDHRMMMQEERNQARAELAELNERYDRLLEENRTLSNACQQAEFQRDQAETDAAEDAWRLKRTEAERDALKKTVAHLLAERDISDLMHDAERQERDQAVASAARLLASLSALCSRARAVVSSQVIQPGELVLVSSAALAKLERSIEG